MPKPAFSARALYARRIYRALVAVYGKGRFFRAGNRAACRFFRQHRSGFFNLRRYKKADDKQPFLRGINSFQLLNDGKRWWVLTIYWQAETSETPLPKEYLKSRKN
jgi:hypothetical protein